MFTIGSVVAVFKSDLSDFNKGVDTAKKSITAFSQKATEASKTFTTGLTAMAVATGVFGFKAVKAYNEATEAQTKLTKIILNHSGETMKNVDALNAQAKAMQKVGVVGADLVTVAQAQFATFDLSSESIQKLIPRFLDMVVAEKGVNATSEDLKGAAQGLGQAFMGNYRSLTQQGFAISDAQKKMIEFGDESEKVQAIQEILGTTYDGVNEAQRRTFQGGMAAAKNTLGDFMQKVGEAITNFFQPMLNKFNDWTTAIGGPDGALKILQEKIQWFIDNKEIVIGGVLGGMSLALGGLVGSILTAVGALAPFIAAGVVLGIIVKKIVDHMGGWQAAWDIFSPKVTEAKDTIVLFAQNAWDWFNTKVIPVVMTLWEWLKKAWDIIQKVAEVAFKILKPALDELWNTISTKLLPTLKEFWDKHGTEIMKFLKILGVTLGVVALIITGVILVAVWAFIKGLTWLIDVINNALTVVNIVWNGIKKIIQTNVDNINRILAVFGTSIADVWNGVKDAASRAFGAVVGFVQNIIDKFQEAKQKAKDFIKNLPGGDIVSKIIPGFANGVQNFSGGWAKVGENGPEIVKLPRGSSVIPNHEIGGMAAGGYTINNFNNFNSEAAVEAFDELMKRRNLAARLGVPSV